MILGAWKDTNLSWDSIRILGNCHRNILRNAAVALTRIDVIVVISSDIALHSTSHYLNNAQELVRLRSGQPSNHRNYLYPDFIISAASKTTTNMALPKRLHLDPKSIPIRMQGSFTCIANAPRYNE